MFSGLSVENHFWWCLLWVSKPGKAALFGMHYTFPEVHLLRNSCWPLGDQPVKCLINVIVAQVVILRQGIVGKFIRKESAMHISMKAPNWIVYSYCLERLPKQPHQSCNSVINLNSASGFQFQKCIIDF